MGYKVTTLAKGSLITKDENEFDYTELNCFLTSFATQFDQPKIPISVIDNKISQGGYCLMNGIDNIYRIEYK